MAELNEFTMDCFLENFDFSLLHYLIFIHLDAVYGWVCTKVVVWKVKQLYQHICFDHAEFT